MLAIKSNDFFRKERGAAEIWSEVLGHYFPAWINLVLTGKPVVHEFPVLYIAMQGEEIGEQGETPSSTEPVLRSIFRNINFNKALQTFFYTANQVSTERLEVAVQQFSFYDELIYKPIFLRDEVAIGYLKDLLVTSHPSFISIDPFEQGLAQEILLCSGDAWSPDFMMLIDIAKADALLKKNKSKNQPPHLLTDKLEDIKTYYKVNKNTDLREEFLIANIESNFISKSYQTFLFRIKPQEKKGKSFYLLFASKSDAACTKLKELLLPYTDYQEDGVPLWGANLNQQQTTLFHDHYDFSILKLIQDLDQKSQLYHNKTLQYIYEHHNPSTSYCRDNYATAFQKLKEQGRVVFVNPKTGQTISTLTYTSIIRYKQ